MSGHIDPTSSFFAAAAAHLRDHASASEAEGDEDAVEFADLIAQRAFDPLSRRMPEDERRELNFQQGWDLTSYIHLTHVQVFVPMWQEPQQLEHIRVQLRAISAWTYGMIRGSSE